jgi:hypothetical protein
MEATARSAKPRDEWTQERRCPAVNSRGERCKRYCAPGDSFCSAHDPRRAETRKRAASKAGKAFVPGRESRQIRNLILGIVEDVRGERVSPPVAHAVANLCNCAINTLRVDLRIRELEEVERRLDTLEGRLSEEGSL